MAQKEYVRDKRSPAPKSEIVSKIMSSIKNKNSKPEIILRKRLWKIGMRGYRLHVKNIPGRPDISFVSKKIAIFVHGCFWHRCPTCQLSLPKNNSKFWNDKFEKNIERDKRKSKELKHLGWKVFEIWECKINRSVEKEVSRIAKVYYGR